MGIEITSGGVTKTFRYYPYDAFYVDANGNINANGDGEQVMDAYFNGTKYYPEYMDTTITSIVGECPNVTPIYVDPVACYPNVTVAYWKYTGSTVRPYEPCHGRGANSVAVDLTLPACSNVYNRAFLDCTTLKRISLPIWEGFTLDSSGFSDQEFAGCTSLEEVYMPAVLGLRGNTTYGQTLTTGYTFKNCTSLKRISLPLCEDLYALRTFYGCTALKSVDLPLCTTLGGNTFYGCTSLENIELPSVVTADGGTFYGCSALKSVRMPECTTIGGSDFTECRSLESVYLPKLTKTGSDLFHYCDAIKEIDLPSLDTINGRAVMFVACPSLNHVFMPNVTPGQINYHSFFYDCPNMLSLTLKNGTASWLDNPERIGLPSTCQIILV